MLMVSFPHKAQDLDCLRPSQLVSQGTGTGPELFPRVWQATQAPVSWQEGRESCQPPRHSCAPAAKFGSPDSREARQEHRLGSEAELPCHVFAHQDLNVIVFAPAFFKLGSMKKATQLASANSCAFWAFVHQSYRIVTLAAIPSPAAHFVEHNFSSTAAMFKNITGDRWHSTFMLCAAITHTTQRNAASSYKNFSILILNMLLLLSSLTLQTSW